MKSFSYQTIFLENELSQISFSKIISEKSDSSQLHRRLHLYVVLEEAAAGAAHSLSSH
jgi:hypothetical protein